MTKQFKIRSFDDLIEFIETQDASPEDIEKIISKTMRVIVLFDGEYDRSYLIDRLKDFWHKYKNAQERPLFLLD